jgi:hypothetical protein
MAKEIRSLVMRANRLLGAQLVERNLIRIEDLETASEKFLELAATGNLRRSSILAVLAGDLKALKEDDLLHHLAETDGLGLVDLRDYEVPDEVKRNLDLDACWATWSVPFDREDEFHYVATAYYLSPAVRAYWEKELAGPVLWYGTTREGIADYLDKQAALVAAADAARTAALRGDNP